MVRVKLPLKKIENKTSKHITYSKRKSGLVKKAYELSTLCDVMVAAIIFSPSGRLTLFEGKKRIEEILSDFINSPSSSRGSLPDEELIRQIVSKLKLELCSNDSASSSNSSGANEDADIDAQIEEIQQQILQYSSQLQDVEKELECYEKGPRIDNSPSELEHHMKILEETLQLVRIRKDALEANYITEPTAHASSSSTPSSYGAGSSQNSFQFPGSFAPPNGFQHLSNNGSGNLVGVSSSLGTFLDGCSFPAGTQMSHQPDQVPHHVHHHGHGNAINYPTAQMNHELVQAPCYTHYPMAAQMNHQPDQIASFDHNSTSGNVSYSHMAPMNHEPNQIPSYACNSGSGIANYIAMNREPHQVSGCVRNMQQAPAASSSTGLRSMAGKGKNSNLDSGIWFHSSTRQDDPHRDN